MVTFQSAARQKISPPTAPPTYYWGVFSDSPILPRVPGMQLEFCWQVWVKKIANTKFHVYSFIGSQVIQFGRTDNHDKVIDTSCSFARAPKWIPITQRLDGQGTAWHMSVFYSSAFFIAKHTPEHSLLVAFRNFVKCDYLLHDVCPSVRMEQLGSRWTDFHDI